MQQLGWDWIDVILFTGDAFVDHPSFGTACIARYLEKAGYRVAVVPQPNWRDDLRDFRKLGAPRLYFAVNAGAMDSMVNHYTAAKRLRHDDAYTPEGRAGQRPDRAVTVYTKILKQLWPDVPVVIGGVEASLRRLTHYDYWEDRLMPSILVDSGADWLCYGMGERPMLELTRAIEAGRNRRQIEQIPQIAFYRTGRMDSAAPEEPLKTSLRSSLPQPAAAGPSHLRGHGWPRFSEALPVSAAPILLNSYDRCCKDKRAFAENFHHIEIQANVLHAQTLIEPVGDGYVQVNPPYPPATTEEMDACWDLPFTKLPHPRYKGKRIPAYDMIKDSIITHRGCFGGCNFCTIAAHQGKFIQSRSEASILEEVRKLAAMPEFHGNISDLGAPTANMYGMHGRNLDLCAKCRRQSCLFPGPCPNLDRSHKRVLELYRQVDAVKFDCKPVPVSAMLLPRDQVNNVSLAVLGDSDTLQLLFDILRQQSGEKMLHVDVAEKGDYYVQFTVAMPHMVLSDDDCQHLFTPSMDNVPYMLCRQIVRDHSQLTARRGCGIVAQPRTEGGTSIVVTLTKARSLA